MTPEQLFTYADRFASRAENAGKGTQYPTLRQTAKRFKVTYDEIEQVADDYQGDGYLGIACAVGISGVGSAAIEPRGEHLVEAYR